jgi:small membrane protein
VNGFQYLVIALLLLLSYATIRAALRGGVRKRVATFWMLVWFSGGVSVLWPAGTLLIARALGIGRGTDLVLYCSVFVMLSGFFYIYTRFRRLDRALTVLVRKLAVENPVLPNLPNPGELAREPDSEHARR